MGWPIEDSEEYETVAGFVIEQFDRLPRPGEKLELEGYVFRVQSTRGRRVSMLRVKAPQKDASADGKIAGSADENAAQALQ